MFDQITTEITTLSSEVRNITIYCPDDLSKLYPVIYMFDGQNLFVDEDATFGTSWGMKEYLEDNNIPLIVVGIDSSRNPDNTRLQEYSPYDFDDKTYGNIKGKGNKTFKWLIEELKPYIDDTYPVFKDRDNTFIGGSSMGGLMAYYGLLKYNDIFSKAACLSPSLWANNPKLLSLTKKSKLNKNSEIYIDYGTLEAKGKHGKDRVNGLYNCLYILKDKEVDLTFRINNNEGHCEANWAKQVPVFINLFLRSKL